MDEVEREGGGGKRDDIRGKEGWTREVGGGVTGNVCSRLQCSAEAY